MKIRFLITTIAAFAIAGCSTVAVDRAKGVASSGAEYVETLKKVNELALDQSIQFTANILPDLPRTAEILAEESEGMTKRAELVGSAHVYFDGIATYFAELEALANGDQSEATAKALGKVVDSLKNQPIELKISDERKTALTGLAGVVAKQIHAAAVEKALIRDADIVAQSLAVSEKMLDEQIRWINLRASLERKKTYLDKVEKPFISDDALGADWKKEWSDSVRTPPVIALLEEAKKASKSMQAAWINVLRGEYSFAELQASLTNVKEGLEAVKALKDSK